MSLAFRKCVWFHYYIFIIAEWPVPLQNVCPYKCILMSYLGHLRQRQWPLRNGPGMSLWPTTPTGFLATPWPNRDHWITITYHMNSCHLLMGGSLGAETSLTDWNVQEISSILLTKCLFRFHFSNIEYFPAWPHSQLVSSYDSVPNAISSFSSTTYTWIACYNDEIKQKSRQYPLFASMLMPLVFI